MADKKTTPFRFQYSARKYTRVMTLEEINHLKTLITNVKPGVFSTIFTVIRVIAFGILVWIRRDIINEEYSIERQEYELRRANAAQDDIDGDDMVGKPRPSDDDLPPVDAPLR